MSWLDEALDKEIKRKMNILNGQVVTVREWDNAAQDVTSGKLAYIGMGLWAMKINGKWCFEFLADVVVSVDDKYSVLYFEPKATDIIRRLQA